MSAHALSARKFGGNFSLRQAPARRIFLFAALILGELRKFPLAPPAESLDKLAFRRARLAPSLFA
jgi:hypothetical protein